MMVAYTKGRLGGAGSIWDIFRREGHRTRRLVGYNV